MSLKDCFKKAGKAFNGADADAINAQVEQMVNDGVNPDFAEKQAVKNFISGLESDLNDIATRAESLGATVVREEVEQAPEENTIEADIDIDTPFEEIEAYIESSGGITLNGDGSIFNDKTGFVASLISENVPEGVDLETALLDVVRRNQAVLQYPNVKVGVFDFDDGSGQKSIDINIVTDDVVLATRVGTELNQVSIWDIANGADINTGGVGGVGLTSGEAISFVQGIYGPPTSNRQEISDEQKANFKRDRLAGKTGLEGAIDGQTGAVELIHFSHTAVEKTDPSKWGSGLSRGVASERNRQHLAPDRSYFGIETDVSPYKKEHGLGSVRNNFTAQGELLYPLDKDPENLISGDTAALEQAIKDAGYIGYYRNHPTLGKVAAVFEPLAAQPPNPKFFQDATPNDLGLHSGVTQAVLDINLPGWKKDGAAPGDEIWSKVSKTPGVKKEELTWLGLEDFLKSEPKAKFTRAEVEQFVTENGVQVEQTIADELTQEFDGFDWNESIDDDPANWEGRVEDFLYDFDQGDLDWMDFNSGQESQDVWLDNWYENNFELLAAHLREESTPDSEAILAAVTEAHEVGGDTIVEALNKFDIDEPLAISELRDAAEMVAGEIAETEYMDNQYTINEDVDRDMRIVGNSDIGFVVQYNGENVADDIYSFNEAELQARYYLEENGLVAGEDSETIAKWQDYVMDGEAENYREIKLKLPNTDGTFSYDVHFPDDNIVSFLRVDDRQLNVKPDSPLSESQLEDKLNPEAEIIEADIRALESTLLSTYDRSKQVVLDAIDSREVKPVDDEKFQAKLNDYTSWEGIVDLMGFDGRVASEYRQLVQKISRKRDMLARSNRDYNSIESKVTRAKAENGDIPANTFFIDEFQSDWHQQGRQHGYGDVTDQIIALENKSAELFELIDSETDVDIAGELIAQNSKLLTEIDVLINGKFDRVPDAPFKDDSWMTLGLKRAITEAVNNGYESVAWPDAEVLMERWSRSYQTLYETQYNKKMPSIVKKLTGERAVHLNLEGESVADLSIEAAEFDVIHLDNGFSVERDGESVTREVFTNSEDATNWIFNNLEKEQGYFIIPITDKLREKVQSKGFTLFQEANGYYDPNATLIRLNESSNASTFMHEFAHFMLDMEQKLDSPNITAINAWFEREAISIADEAGVTPEAVIEFIKKGPQADLPVEGFEAINRATHEHFARGFEAYLMEGNSPSVELRNVFRVFARLIRAVYDAVKGGLNAPNLDNEMRQVFDRIIATDEQIAASEARARYKPLFTDAVMAGMTEDQFTKYQEQASKVTDKATETLRDKVLKELTRVNKKWWNAELKEVAIENEERLSKEPIYVAREKMATDKDFKMDRASVKEILGIDKIPPPLRNMTVTGKEGSHPDDVAATFGFGGGQDFLNDLVSTPTIKQAAQAAAQEEMLERHGDIMNDGSMEQLADEAVRNEERGELMLREIRILSRGINVPAIDKQSLKFMANQAIGKLNATEIRPDRYRKAEIRSAQEAITALNAGDKEAALRAKTQQAMNFYLWKASMESRSSTEKILRYVKRFNKKTIRERLAKTGAGHLDQILSILNRFELRKSQSVVKHDEKMAAINDWLSERSEAGENIVVSERVLNERSSSTIHWKKMPFEELMGVYESLLSIEHNAKSLNEMQLAEEKLNYEQVVARMLDSMSKVKNVFTSQRTSTIDDQGIRYTVKGLIAENTKIPYMMRWLDGGENIGIMHEAIMQPMNDAFNNEMVMWSNIGDVVTKAINTRSKADKKRHAIKLYIPEIESGPTEFGVGNDGNLYGHQVLAVALNTGNEGNLRKMLIGEGWAADDAAVSLDNPQLKAVLNHMTDADWDLVELIWKQIDSLYPDLAAVHQRTSGIPLERVEATPFEVNGRTVTGGYYPLHYDPKRSLKAAENAEKENEATLSMFNAGGLVIPAVTTGARINRTEYTGPIKLSLDVVPQHLQEVIHFITHYEAVRGVNKLIKDPRIVEAITAKLGADEYRMLKPWLNDIAKDGRESHSKTKWDKLFQKLRFGTTLGVMGFKASTGLIQIAGLSNSASEVGAARLMKAIAKVTLSEQSIAESWEWAKANSKVLNHRTKTMDREIKNAMSALQNKRTWFTVAQEASMMHIALIQTYMVDLPTWYAAYDKGMVDFDGDDARAFKYADWVIENIQGSGATKDLAGIMRNQNEFFRLTTMFMTFFSSLWNLQRDTKRGFSEDRISTGGVAAKLMFMWMMPAIYEAMMREGIPEDDEDKEELLQRVMLNTAMMPVASMPIVRDIGNAVFTDFSYNASPVGQVVGNGLDGISGVLNNALSGEEITRGSVKRSTKLIGAAFSVPGVNQAWASYEHLEEVLTQGEDFATRELLFGPDRE